MGNVLVLIERIFSELAFLLLDREFDKEEHHGLQRGDRHISRSFARDMLMKQNQSRRGLVNADKFMSALQHILGFLMRRRRLEEGMLAS